MVLKKRDYYTVLGLSRRAKPEEIKKAYHERVMQHHPDKNPGNKLSEILFMELNEAYSTLKDPGKRAEYDYSLQVEMSPAEELPVETLETLFGKVDMEDKGTWISGFNTHLLNNQKKEFSKVEKFLMVLLPILMMYFVFHFFLATPAQAPSSACNTPRVAVMNLFGGTYRAAFSKEPDNRWGAPIVLTSDLADKLHFSTNYAKVIANLSNDAPPVDIGYPYLEEQALANTPARIKTVMAISVEWNCNGQKQSYNYGTGN